MFCIENGLRMFDLWEIQALSRRWTPVWAHQQRAAAVQLGQQDAAVVEEVGRLHGAVQVSGSRGQPGVQLRVHVKLPGTGGLLDLPTDKRQKHNEWFWLRWSLIIYLNVTWLNDLKKWIHVSNVVIISKDPNWQTDRQTDRQCVLPWPPSSQRSWGRWPGRLWRRPPLPAGSPPVARPYLSRAHSRSH